MRNNLRAFETLEDRRLLAAQPWDDGLYYPPTAVMTSRLNIPVEEYMRRSAESWGSSDGGIGGGRGDGAGGAARVMATDIESNNTFRTAQLIGIGTLPGQSQGATIVGATTLADFDYYAMDLRAGDIFDTSISSGVATWDLSLRDARDKEVAGTNTFVPAGLYPSASPLTDVAQASMAVVIPESGRYYIRVGNGPGSYTLNIDLHRPVLESQPVGTKQILFLDFDGADFNIGELVGGALGAGTARLSPLSDFLAGWNLGPQDEGAVIDSIIRNVVYRYTGTMPTVGTAGYYSATGIAGQFDLDIRNSRDHVDPWTEPNVSRVIVGGTAAELGIGGIYGIASSLDLGNFDTEESAVVLLDTLSAPGVPAPGLALSVNQVPFSGSKTKIDLIGEIVGNIIAHESGHYFGSFHQQNVPYLTMSTGLGVDSDAAVGPDGVYGTADDVNRIIFGTGKYDAAASAIPYGVLNSAATVSWGLATGTTGGGTIKGNVFNDRNSSRSLDSADLPLAGVRVYVDANRNAAYDIGEVQAFSAANGDYSLQLLPGTYTIRSVPPAGYQLTAPVGEAYVVGLAAGQVVSSRNFGNKQVDQKITGTKFNDVNGNGIWDSGESTIEGIWIYLDLDGDNRIDLGEPATKTGADGTYKLSFPGPGTYAIREIVDSGFVQTYPGVSNDGDPLNDYEHTVVLTGDPVIDAPRLSGLNFGNRLTVDFGDAPASYGSASHGFVSGLILGDHWDAEESSQYSANALGDDLNGPKDASGNLIDDEDGIVLSRPLVSGSANNRISVKAQNTTGVQAYLQGWIDYNHNGTFEAAERVITNQPIGTGTTDVTFSAPTNALLGDTLARFRYSSQLGIGPVGNVASGEVEDYVLSVTDTLNLAVDDRFSVSRNSALNSLDVLANDFQLPGETLEIISVSASQAGGTVQVSPTNKVLYTPPSGYIGQDSFTYTMRNSGGDVDSANVIVDVNLFFANPMAIDDSFNVATNGIDLPLNVLANDIEGQNGALTIVSVTQPDKGGQVSISTGGKSLRYTPSRGFGGTEFLAYTVADASGAQSSAQVTMHTLPGDQADDEVLIQLVATDLAGNPISTVQQGQDFLLEVMVDDLRYDTLNPGIAAGVYSAYADVLYNLQLVSTVSTNAPNAKFNYEVSFFNDYVNFQTGDADIPGIIDEFGAFSSRAVMNTPNPVKLAAIKFNARSPGIASFMPDPADDVPPSDTLLFDTPSSQVPTERIRYIGTQLEIVGDGVQFPIAVDDSVPDPIPAGSIRFPIDVLANDLPGSTGTISIVSAGAGSSGTTLIDNRGTSNPADDRILYTPNAGFNGTDQFRYTIQDGRGIQSSATVTVRVGSVAGNDLAGLRLSVTDLNGQSIDEITVGSQFQLRGYVQDLRGFGTDRGIYAVYEDVLYTASKVSPVASTTNDPNLGFQVQFGPNYQQVREGDIRTPGVINEIGAVQIENGNQPLGSAEQLLFIVTMTANATGLANFIADPADISPLHDTLTFQPPAPVSIDQIRYGFDSLNIVSAGGGGASGEGYHNYDNPYDVNADGVVSPLDVLLVIHQLNGTGKGGSGEGENGGIFYTDVDNNGFVTPIDALLVVNFINENRIGGGEGEYAAPGVELGRGGVSGQLVSGSTVVTELEATSTGNVGVRLTGQQYGPAREDVVRDGIFDDLGEEESLDELLAQLAPEIEENWNNFSD